MPGTWSDGRPDYVPVPDPAPRPSQRPPTNGQRAGCVLPLALALAMAIAASACDMNTPPAPPTPTTEEAACATFWPANAENRARCVDTLTNVKP